MFKNKKFIILISILLIVLVGVTILMIRACNYEPNAVTYTVTFMDWNDTILDTQIVDEGEDAVAPTNPTRTGYTFTGWDKIYTNVQSNLTVTAQYSQDNVGLGAGIFNSHPQIGVDDGLTGSAVFNADFTYSFEFTLKDQYSSVTYIVNGTWADENNFRVIKSFSSITKDLSQLGVVYNTYEYTGSQLLVKAQELNMLDMLNRPINDENDEALFIMDFGSVLINEDVTNNNMIFVGGYFGMFNLNFDIWIPNGNLNVLEDVNYEFCVSVYAINKTEATVYTSSLGNITFADTLTPEEDSNYATITASIILPGDIEETEITLRCLVSEEPNQELSDILNTSALQIGNYHDYAEIGTSIENYIVEMTIGFSDEDQVAVTSDMISGYPADPNFEGYAVLTFTYHNFVAYKLIYFYESGLEVIENTIVVDMYQDQGYNNNTNVVLAKGSVPNLTSAGSSISFVATNDLHIAFSPTYWGVPISDFNYVSGLSLNGENEIQNDAGVYLITIRYNFEDTETYFDTDIVVVIVDENNEDESYISSFDISGNIIGTDGGAEADTYDLNGTKLLVYYNLSDTPIEIDLTNDMIKSFTFDDYIFYKSLSAEIEYSYTYLGVEYTLTFFYSISE